MAKKIAVFLITLYQRTLSPDHSWLRRVVGGACRFTPTCSEYTKEAILKYGVIKGSWLGAKRISHCHPFTPAGHDPVP